jgi:HlyD family secretion protein
MASKELRPKTRLGKSHPGRVKAITWILALLVCGGGLYAAYKYTGTTEVEVPVARARKADFIISVRTRGDIRSLKSTILSAPPAPGLRIVKLAANGSFIHKGDVLVEFDGSSQDQLLLSRQNSVQNAENNIIQQKAQTRMSQESDSMDKVQSEYSLERSKLDASKAEVVSAIDGEKARIQVGVSEGSLQRIKAVINAHEVGYEADMNRLSQNRDKAYRDLKTTQGYLAMMQLKAPTDGIVNVLSNFRSQGQFGQSQPPYKEGDNVYTGAPIVEIPDLTQMYIDLKLEEVDRGKLEMGQQVRIRVDAIPDKEFLAEIDYISPIANLVFRGGQQSEKTFPARATLKNLDERLRPGMSSTAEVIIEKQVGQLLIPTRASFDKGGKPAVYVQVGKNFAIRQIEGGKKNEEDIVVKSGLTEGEIVTLENPAEAAKRAKKKF